MKLKLTNEVRSSVNLLHKAPVSSVKEERRRNGRYVAILVGICLFLLAIYHAWVRRIPVVASLVVPALIMFVYVGWVLFTASRDKRKFLDAEAALNAAAAQENAENESHIMEISPSNIEISETSNKTNVKIDSSSREKPPVSRKIDVKPEEKTVCFIKPIILVNDKLPEDFDQKWTNLVQTVTTTERQKGYPRRKFKRKFCRSRRHAAFKRSYSIG
ncbi:unnamed protein product [Danaus chrysippus]|uniref:(African queen) hypothetical protein n=1 Tax=Danaus chrysippus TaxID=151541 RepID=A0A8J2VXF9_9NEOP|nr:unnamed protein product [Danaus chrysippus]